MNVVSLSEHLRDNKEAILTLLTSMDIEDFSRSSNDKYIRFARESGRNPSSVSLNVQTLSFNCFSTGDRGDIYTLIMDRQGLNFPAALKYVISTLELDASEYQGDVHLPFGGFYRKIARQAQEPESFIQVYDDEILKDYQNNFNLMFLRDGISFETQEKFGIGYDLMTNRITIPILTLDGRLCGILGRKNDIDCPKENRYRPLLPCPRSLTIYGYSLNYSAIQNKGLCVIVEAEKSVMQMDSFGCHLGLGASGSTVSETQAKYIKSLMLPRVIVAFDEGLEEEHIRKEANKLRSDNPILKNRVGYVFDRGNVILPKGSKASPSDLGRAAFAELVTKHIVWLD